MLPKRSTIHNPKMRRATQDDFDSLYEIWMQDHINPFMSFEQMPKDEFRPIFNQMFNDSEIYVIEDAGTVVAARRMSFCTDEHAHTAEFASFGVHQDHLRKGYGELFYQLFIDLIQTQKKEISRIEISQETDNEPALRLANKMGFTIEATFPDWLPRATGKHNNKWYTGERFCSLLLNPEILKTIKSNINQFVPELPVLRLRDNRITIEINDNKANGYLDGKLQATCSLSTGVRRYAHIQFWTVQLEAGCDAIAVQAFLRQLAVIVSSHHKKIEILTSDQNTLDVLAKMGFHCRGEKIAARKVGDDYYNEVCVDLSFFDIEDAKKMLACANHADSYLTTRISFTLNLCKSAIQQELEDHGIDQYAKLYLENLAFQMTREGMGETRMYTQSNAPWLALIESLPLTLKPAFMTLGLLTKVVDKDLLIKHDDHSTGYGYNLGNK